MAKDYYEILGVSRNASQSDIKKAFKSLSKKYHPDKYSTKSEEERAEATAKFQEISEAYNVLSDETKKAEYDNEGSFPFGFGNPFSGMEMKGANIRTTVNITLEDIYNSAPKVVTYYKKVKCHHCHGSGSEDGKTEQCQYCNGTGRYRKQFSQNNMTFIQETICPHCHGIGFRITNKCNTCGGTGFIDEELTTTIRPTVSQLAQGGVVISGLGDAPLTRGRNGDLIVAFKLQPHKVFETDGLNLITNVKLNLQELWEGCDKKIEYFNGKQIIAKIPPMADIKKSLKITGKGLSSNGDLLINIELEMPKNLTDRQKELINEFYKIENLKE